MSQVLQVFDVFEIWICRIFGFCWPPKVTKILSKSTAERDVDGNNNTFYLKVTVDFYYLIHIRI